MIDADAGAPASTPVPHLAEPWGGGGGQKSLAGWVPTILAVNATGPIQRTYGEVPQQEAEQGQQDQLQGLGVEVHVSSSGTGGG